jgi:hypothetical protein
MKLKTILAAALAGVFVVSGLASAQEKLDPKTVADAYVYLLGRALAIRRNTPTSRSRALPITSSNTTRSVRRTSLIRTSMSPTSKHGLP